MIFFIISLVIFFLIEAILVSFEQMGFATILAILCAIGYSYFHFDFVWPFIQNHYITILSFLPIYLIIGILYSRIRWKFFVIKKRNEVKEKAESFKEYYKNTVSEDKNNLEYENVNDTTYGKKKYEQAQLKYNNILLDSYKKDMWIRYLEQNHLSDYIDAPKVFKHKSKIINWIAYWPPSLLWFMINDPITAIIKSIYYSMVKGLQKTSDKVYEGMGDIYK